MSKRKLKVGDKVRIKTFSTRPMGWPIFGAKDEYMGKVVTVECVNDNYFWVDVWCFKHDECEPVY